jgi:site-specific DNA recombinase
MKKRAALYGRVSTDEQADKGYSLPSQLDACEKYAEQHGLVVVAKHQDDFTGTSLDRPGLNKLRAMVRRNEIDAVIVNTSDRWTRRLAHMLILREELNRANIELHFVNKGKSEETPESRMFENIEGVFNEYWRERMIENIRRGMREKAKTGKVVGLGHPPYGYQYNKEDEMFEIVPREAEIVRMIYRWYTSGDGSGEPMTVYSITKRLSEMRVTTPGEKSGAARKRKPGMWKQGTVHRILKNETYAGIWRYGKKIGNNGQGGIRPISEQIAVTVPAILTREEWTAAQERREFNKRMSRRNCKHKYLLRGLIKCGCGAAMNGEKSRRSDEYFYYRCSRRVNRFRDIEGRVCNEKYVRGDILEPFVWDFILDIMTNRERFENGLRDAQTAERDAIQPKFEQLTLANDLIIDCEKKARALVSRLAELPEGGLISETLQDKIAKLEQKHAALIKERDILRAEVEAKQLTDEEIQSALAFREAVIVGMQNPTFEDKRKTLEDLRVEVIVTDQVARVTCRIPIPPAVIDLRTQTKAASPPP